MMEAAVYIGMATQIFFLFFIATNTSKMAKAEDRKVQYLHDIKHAIEGGNQ